MPQGHASQGSAGSMLDRPESSDLADLVETQRRYFATGITRDERFRRAQLAAIVRMCREHESEMADAVLTDLHRSRFDAILSEVAPVVSEALYARRMVGRWMRPRRVRSPAALFPSRARVEREPFGVSLIIATWNYPIHLALRPLVSAVAGGNCAVIKPGELSGASSRLLARLIPRYFPREYIAVVEGNAAVARELVERSFDHLFFTGSERVGREVMARIGPRLIPAVLELGGCNPCIIDRDVDIEVTARRIAWAKYFNAGQTCLAPGFLVVHREIAAELIEAISRATVDFYGSDAARSPSYGRMVDEEHAARVASLLRAGELLWGGGYDLARRYIEPTGLAIDWESPLLGEEIFGPILPVIEYADPEDVVRRLRELPTPLALYLFSRNRRFADGFTRAVASGSVVVNDLIVHATLNSLPFGGIGASGFGRYHGRSGFEAFTWERSVLERRFLLDWKLRYPPHRVGERLLGWIARRIG